MNCNKETCVRKTGEAEEFLVLYFSYTMDMNIACFRGKLVLWELIVLVSVRKESSFVHVTNSECLLR